MLNLSGHANKAYEQELQMLSRTIVEMGRHVVHLLCLAHKSIKTGKNYTDYAKQIDKQINKLELSVEQQVTSIITVRDIYMDELRFVTSALKISTSLERMGDMSKNTVKRLGKLNQYIPTNTRATMQSMIKSIVDMMGQAEKIFYNFDEGKARALWQKDDAIDSMYKSLFKNIQGDIIKKPEDITNLTHIIFTAKNLERIADHTADLGRMLYYINIGKKIDKSDS